MKLILKIILTIIIILTSLLILIGMFGEDKNKIIQQTINKGKKIIIHNKTPFKLQIIIGYYDGEDWISQGYFYIKSNKDLVFYTKGNIFYYRAKSYYGNLNWYPSISQAHKNLYVTDKAFKIKSLNSPTNARVERFKV